VTILFPSESYQVRVNSALDRALGAAQSRVLIFDVDRDRLVIFSDHHKGVRDAADDFRESQNPYHAALGYYFEKGHTLVVLGDVEELWENNRDPVLTMYRATLELERDFHEDGHRYWRVWGNHDDDWRFESLVKRHLWPIFLGVDVQESILLVAKERGRELGRVLLVHGHQGTLESDRLKAISRYVVRYLWRPIQRRTGWNLNTPAKDWRLRKIHNIALYNWAVVQEGLVLIAGHTHKPVFYDEKRVDELQRALARARRLRNKEKVALARAALEYVQVRDSRQGFRMEQPCYFNTGCCCYADGDITGLEIDSGMIRLVRWPDNEGNPLPKVLTEAKLKDVFSAVARKGRLLERPLA
jgi:UDP-2,3-diacylglucosamine pyrophosphatase LpxH